MEASGRRQNVRDEPDGFQFPILQFAELVRQIWIRSEINVLMILSAARVEAVAVQWLPKPEDPGSNPYTSNFD